MFDLSEFKAVADPINDGLPFEPRHPVTDEPLGAVWQVASYQSKAYKAAERLARTKGMKSFRTGKVNAADMDEDEIALLASLVLSWSGMRNDGRELACTPDNVKMVLSDQVIGIHIRQQLDEHAADTAAFFKASKKPSPTPSDTKSDT